jgi:hypothetical protein
VNLGDCPQGLTAKRIMSCRSWRYGRKRSITNPVMQYKNQLHAAILWRKGRANLGFCLYTVGRSALNLRCFKNCKWPERAGTFPGTFRRNLRAILTAVAIDAAGAATKAETRKPRGPRAPICERLNRQMRSRFPKGALMWRMLRLTKTTRYTRSRAFGRLAKRP